MAKRTKPDYSDRINVELGRVPHEYTETNYPSVVGWRWVSNGQDHELTWSRDETPMMYSIKNPEGKWSHTSCRHPKMAGITKLADARDVAEWFINGHMLPEHDSMYEASDDIDA